MEILTAILCFLQVANMSFTVLDRFKTTDKEREVLSNVLLQIGILLNTVADDLEKAVYPHGKCREMEHYAQQLKLVLQGKMSGEEIAELSKMLNESLQVERLLAELNNLSEENKKGNLEMLRTAAGSFMAWSNLSKINS